MPAAAQTPAAPIYAPVPAPAYAPSPPRPAMPVKYLTVQQVAAQLAISERTVRAYCQYGRMKSLHIGGVVRIDPADLEAFIAECRANGGRLAPPGK